MITHVYVPGARSSSASSSEIKLMTSAERGAAALSRNRGGELRCGRVEELAAAVGRVEDWEDPSTIIGGLDGGWGPSRRDANSSPVRSESSGEPVSAVEAAEAAAAVSAVGGVAGTEGDGDEASIALCLPRLRSLGGSQTDGT